MSLDKYVMRGFTGSLGTGMGKWVATSTPQNNQQPSSQQPSSHQDRGTSFVLGGSASSRSGRSHAGSQQSYKEDRYSFDSERVQHYGTVQQRTAHKECFRATSLLDVITSKVGQRIILTLCLYGIALSFTLYVIFKYFGTDNSERQYSIPKNMPRHARPLWDRER